MSRHTWFLTALLLASVFTRAETTGGQSEDVKALLQRIDQLEQRVAELEAGKNTSTAHLQDLKAQDTQIPTGQTVEEHLSTQMHDEHSQNVRDVEGHFPSMQLRGFGDVDFSATDERGTTSGFTLGQFVLHVASPLSKKVAYFGELSFTAQPTSYTADVERSIIRYSYNDHFKLSFGRYHTPINYWNTAFHHGLWLQTTISRPEMIRFGGRFLPVHFLGMLAEGNIPSGSLGLGYEVGLGNGRAGTISRAGDNGDVNSNRAWVGRIFARPAAMRDLQIGGAFYRDKITPIPALTGTPSFGEWISSAQIAWTHETPELISEFANVHHRNNLTGNIYNSQAYYIQLAYRLPWEARKWKPYYRFEYTHVPASEPLFSAPAFEVTDLVGSTAGVRFDITDFAAFKWEYRHTKHRPTDPPVNGVFVQTAFTF
ncbi:MAG: hypothetical protein DMG86_10640 [Acidobacteria bacterium]|nr:MAG: hypothetical protein AUI85_06465 [Acidobacteriales bacterium 13_1_40CM_3_55_5]PYX01217.1 MAG: hypothetical protein DMG86_10640 [Acidobacteriota bacterium]